MIYDIRQVISFVEKLPAPEKGYCYLLMLTMRSRFVKERLDIKVPDTVLEREIVAWYHYEWRDVYIRKVRKLSILGENVSRIYRITKDTLSFPVPQGSVAIMAVINPSNMVKALASLINKAINKVFAGAELRDIVRVRKRWFANLHKYSRRVFHTIDVDKADLLIDVLKEVTKYTEPFMVIKTVRGYHVIIHLPSLKDNAPAFFKEFVQKWLNEARKEYVDKDGKPLIEYLKQGLEPVPGTIYGDSEVKMVEWEGLL